MGNSKSIKGLEHLTLGDMRELKRSLQKATAHEAQKILSEFRDIHGLNDHKALKAGRLAKDLAV